MSGLIEWLERLNEKDTKVRAVLRRSLAFDPGDFVPAYAYVEPHVAMIEDPWRRQCLYLAAGLWAVHWREDRRPPTMSIGAACARYQTAKGSTSVEQRFINLLDADCDQLPHRSRQMIALLREQSIDFEGLLHGILRWNDEFKRTQKAWARDFYRALNDEASGQDEREEEINK